MKQLVHCIALVYLVGLDANDSSIEAVIRPVLGFAELALCILNL